MVKSRRIVKVLRDTAVEPLETTMKRVSTKTDINGDLPYCPLNLQPSHLFDSFKQDIKNEEIAIGQLFNIKTEVASENFKKDYIQYENNTVDNVRFNIMDLLTKIFKTDVFHNIRFDKDGPLDEDLKLSTNNVFGRDCDRKRGGEPDLVAYDDYGLFLVFQIKSHFRLEEEINPMPLDTDQLIASFHDSVANLYKWAIAVAQTCGYMIRNKCCYGVLMTYNYFYVLHCTGTEDVMYVTRRIECTEHYYITKLAYVVLMAQRHTGSIKGFPSFTTINAFRAARGMTRVTESSSKKQRLNEEDDEEQVGDTYNTGGSSSNQSGQPLISGGNSSSSFGGATDAGVSSHRTSASSTGLAGGVLHRLDVDDLTGMELIEEGRSGQVYKLPAKPYFPPRVVKLVDATSSENYPRILKEDYVYCVKSELQGTLLPKILDHVSYGSCLGLSMNYINVLPDNFSEWKESDKDNAILVLQKLANHGLFQNDIRGSHFGYDETKNMVMLDLEDVELVEDVAQIDESDVKEYLMNASHVIKGG